MRDCDVLIVGGGPAGAILAALLAKRGRDIVVLERDAFPRFHIGESLLPMSCEVFDKLSLRGDLDARYIRKYGAMFICSQTGREREYLFSEAFDKRFAHAYQVPRADFDELLLNRARQAGARVMQPCKVTEILFDGERAVGVRAEGRELHAPFVVDGSGRGSMLASRMNNKERIVGLDTSALFAHYEGIMRADGRAAGHIYIVIFEHGWMWLIPFRGELTSVGAVVSSAWMDQRSRGESLDEFLERTLALSPWMTNRIRGSRRTSEVRSAADFSYGVSNFVGDGWLCVGDACGFIDPLFSSGAHLAIKGADLAADALGAALDGEPGAFAHYEQTMRSANSLFLGVVQAFYDGSFREMLFEPDQRHTLRQIITSMLSGDVVHHERVPAWVQFVRQRFPAAH